MLQLQFSKHLAKGGGAQAVVSRGVFADPFLQIVLVYVEVLLGLWLLLTTPSFLSWSACFVVFFAFSATNLSLAAEGQRSCGCFGPVPANPWLVFVVESATLAVMLLFRPDFEWRNLRPPVRSDFIIVMVAVGILMAFALPPLLGVMFWGQLSAQLRHQPFSINPRVVDFGQGCAGEIRDGALEISNWSETPIRIVGANSSCAYVTAERLPITILPGKSRRVALRAQFPEKQGRFQQRGILFIHADGLGMARFEFTGVSSGAD